MTRVSNALGAQHKTPLAATIAGLLAMAFGFVILFGLAGCGPKQVEVPDLAYMESAQAEKALTDAGLKLGTVTEKVDSELKIGDFVLEQSVKAGEKANEGSTVDIVVSAGPKSTDNVKVPDLKGMTVEEAEKALDGALLIAQPGEAKYSDKVEPGKICAQSPKAGKEQKVLGTVTYSISLGKETVEVPNLVGMSKDDANNALEKAGLGNDSTESYSDNVDEGLVIGQDVKAGEKVEKGSVVTIDVSLGAKPPEQVAVPDITSYNLAAAKSTLDSAGFEWEWSGDEDGTVTSVDPAPGTKMDKGSTVTFVLEKPKKDDSSDDNKDDKSDASKDADEKDESDEATVPDVVGMDAGDAIDAIEDAGLEADGDDEGYVIDQDPDGDDTVDKGDTVTITTDKGALDDVDPEKVIWNEGLGEFVSAEKVEVEGEWRWQVTTHDINGKEHDFFIDRKGKVEESNG